MSYRQDNRVNEPDQRPNEELLQEITFTDDIRQMMFVSGETAEASTETTTLIEEIVRQQVIEIVSINPPVG